MFTIRKFYGVLGTVALLMVGVMIFNNAAQRGSLELHLDGRGADAGDAGKLPHEPVSSDEIFYGKLKDDDPRLVESIRRKYVSAPSQKAYELLHPTVRYYSEASNMAAKLLKNKRDGFFVETGAFDGELGSNSLYFEKELGWGGVLIEPNPVMFETLLQKNRKVFAINAGLSVTKTTMQMEFVEDAKTLQVVEGDDQGRHVYMATLFPLYSLLLGVNRTTIDYLVLAAGGTEVDVLYTLPFDKLDIGLIQIEYGIFANGPEDGAVGKSSRKLHDIRAFFEMIGGFSEVALMKNQDVFFIKNSLMDDELRKIAELHEDGPDGAAQKRPDGQTDENMERYTDNQKEDKDMSWLSR